MNLTTASRARIMEALVGAGVVGSVGGAIGGATYDPKEPQEWMDRQGDIHRRELSSDEKAEKLKRVAKAFLIGAGAGAPGSVGIGALNRSSLNRMNQEAFEEMQKKLIAPLRARATDLEKAVGGGHHNQMSLFPTARVVEDREGEREVGEHAR